MVRRFERIDIDCDIFVLFLDIVFSVLVGGKSSVHRTRVPVVTVTCSPYEKRAFFWTPLAR